MPNKLHGRATTTPTIRRTIRESKDTILTLAKRYGINPKTVLKWKHRKSEEDAPSGAPSRSKSLTAEEEAVVISFRKHTLLSLDDCFYTLKKIIPHLSRSCLYRCFKRHGMGKLPVEEQPKAQKKKFKTYPPGYVHVDITQVYTAKGRLYLFVAIDRTTKFCYAALYKRQTADIAVNFLQSLRYEFPNYICKILTDNGLQFTHYHAKAKEAHVFTKTCSDLDIEHRLTKAYHPWTNGQVERMNRTLKEATVKKYYYKDHTTLQKHLKCFIHSHNFGHPLKALDGKTPYEKICLYLQSSDGESSLNPMYKFREPYR